MIAEGLSCSDPCAASAPKEEVMKPLIEFIS